MIAKRVERKQHASNYKTLAHYILDGKGGGQKVRDVWSTNCQAPDDFDLAIKEVTATQALNTRSKIDKSYHLVISLAPGEDLTADQWKEVEAAFCKAIGLSEHQRISTIHSDTDHVHLHVALSKVHPTKLTCVEPYYDKFKLQDTCRHLEHTYGLKPGIGEGKKILTPSQEAHQGLEAFSTYIKDNIAADLMKILSEQGRTWKDAQDLCGRFGVEIRERGAGLVFSHTEKRIFVKASSIDRRFSRAGFERTLGPFERSSFDSIPEKVYKPAPLVRSRDASKLYEEYVSLRENERAIFLERWGKLSADRKQRLLEIKERYAGRRQEIKRDTLIPKGRKRDIYRKVSEQMRKELENLYAGNPDGLQSPRLRPKTKSWREFIHERASAGDEAALGVLRSKLRPSREFGDGAFLGKPNNVMVSSLLRTVNTDGSIEYQTPGGGAFIDRADAIILKSLSEVTVKAALLTARAKFGLDFELRGSPEFVQNMAQYIGRPGRDEVHKRQKEIGRNL